MNKAIIFTDGAAKGNPGPGGYGAVLSFGDSVLEIGEGKSLTTNNEMELRAVLEALKQVPANVREVEIYTDSKYVVEGAKGWIFGWMKNGWKIKTGSDVLHKEVWQELATLLKKVKINWHKVPGHVGIIGNERADVIASDLGEGKKVDLYKGSRKGYKHEIENVSYDEEKAMERSDARKRQSLKAYSYVSLVDGVVKTHQTWKECEGRVKGQSGVRFKKALSEKEEKEIIKDFKQGS
ncbi:ribonuclease HI [Candidatus Kaiserbacteria bacterium]|nr:ribonuclease HI [Candidatus Kaiserbacteria bacterium]USN92471.1 MAG: ribonuclease HI [Candidatus Nomurabacteria bacterium]